MLAQQHPGQDTTEPHRETELNNLTVHSTWIEILSELHAIQTELRNLKGDNGIDKNGSTW